MQSRRRKSAKLLRKTEIRWRFASNKQSYVNGGKLLIISNIARARRTDNEDIDPLIEIILAGPPPSSVRIPTESSEPVHRDQPRVHEILPIELLEAARHVDLRVLCEPYSYESLSALPARKKEDVNTESPSRQQGRRTP